MSRRQGAIGIAVICVLLLTVAATGGTSLDVTEDRVLENVTAEPHSGSYGAYAYLDEDDELVIDLTANNDRVQGDGVNPEALTGIEDVFTLTYTGEQYAHVWLEHEAENVSFYTERGSIEGEQNNVTLGPDQSVAVGFTVDTRDRDTIDPLIDSIEINAKVADEERSRPIITPCPPGASIEVAAPDKQTRSVSLTDVQTCEPESIDLQSLRIGDHATLESADVTFETDDDASFTIVSDRDRKGPQRVDDLHPEHGVAPIGSATVEDAPDPDAIETVTYDIDVDRAWLEREGIEPETVEAFEYDDESGEWTEADIEIADEKDDAVRYAATVDRLSSIAIGADAPLLDVEQATVEPNRLEAGDSATVRTTIANEGTVPADVDLTLLRDDAIVETTTESVPAGETIAATLESEFDDPGTHDVAIAYEYTREGGDEFALGDGRIDAGTIAVSESRTPDDDPDGDPIQSGGPDDTDGFGALIRLALGGIGLAVVALWARWARE